jgi:hypothetical protein
MEYLDFTYRQMLPPTLGIVSFKTKLTANQPRKTHAGMQPSCFCSA